MGTFDDGIYYPDENDSMSMQYALAFARHQITGNCWALKDGSHPFEVEPPARCQRPGEWWMCVWSQPEFEDYALPEYTLVCAEHRASHEREAVECEVPAPIFVPR